MHKILTTSVQQQGRRRMMALHHYLKTSDTLPNAHDTLGICFSFSYKKDNKALTITLTENNAINQGLTYKNKWECSAEQACVLQKN